MTARRLARFGVRLCAALLALASLAALALVAAGLWAAARLDDELAARGIEDWSLRLAGLDTTGIRLRDLRLGSDAALTAERLEVGLVLPDLLDGRLGAIEADGLRVRARLGPDGLSLGSLDTALRGPAPDKAGPPALPFESLRLRDAALLLDTGFGPARLAVEGELRPAGREVAARLDWAVAHAMLQLQGDLEVSGQVAGPLRASGQLHGGSFAWEGSSGTIGQGRFAASLQALVPERAELSVTVADATVPPLRLSRARVEASWRTGELIGNADLTLAEAAGSVRADWSLLDLETGAPTLAAAAELTLPRLSRLAVLPAAGWDGAVDGRIELFAAGPELLAPPDTATPPAARLQAALRISAANETAGLSLEAEPSITVDAVSAGFDVSLADGALLRIGGEGLPRLPVSPPYALALRQQEGQPLARFRTEEGRWTAALAGAAALHAAGRPVLDATVDASARLADEWRIAVGRLALSSAELPVGGLRARLQEALLSGAIDAAGWRLAGPVDARIAGTPAPEVRLQPTRLRLDVQLEQGEAGLHIHSRGCQVIGPGRLDFGDRWLEAGRLRLCPAGAAPVLAGDVRRLRLQAGAQPVELRLHDKANDGSEPIAALLPAITLAAEMAMESFDWKAQATLADASLAVPQAQARLAGLAADAQASGGRDGLTGALQLGRATLRDARKPVLFTPVQLSGEAGYSDGEVSFDLDATAGAGRAQASAEGTYRPGGALEAQIALAPLRFAADGLQPRDLAPGLGGLVTDVTGEASATATLTWREGSLDGRGEVTLNGIGMQTDLAVLEDVDAVIRLASLWPPATAPEQTVGIRLLDVGVPLRDGGATFTYEKSGELRLHIAQWPWAGGRIFIENAVLRPAAEQQEAVLSVDGVDLGELATLMDVDGLSVTGTVGGTIPVVLQGDTVEIRDGRLTSEGGGVIRYRGEAATGLGEADGSSMDLLFAALRDFHYDSLAIGLNGRTTGDIDVTLHISGANPELYEGYPFELNMTVGGKLVEMLRSGYIGFRVPEEIRRQLERQRP